MRALIVRNNTRLCLAKSSILNTQNKDKSKNFTSITKNACWTDMILISTRIFKFAKALRLYSAALTYTK